MGEQGIGVGAAGEARGIGIEDGGAVNLMDPLRGIGRSADGGEEAAGIGVDVVGGVLLVALGVAEIEGGEGAGADTADARAEAVRHGGALEKRRGVPDEAGGILAALEHGGRVSRWVGK